MTLYFKGGEGLLNDPFNKLLILSMYNKITNTGQIHNVLTGRTTPSILFLVEVNQWHHLYGLFPKISRESIAELHQVYLNNCYIEKADKKFQLTDKSRTYFFNKTDLTHVDDGPKRFDTAVFIEDFWSMIRFVSQVISEKTYRSNQYIPHRNDLTSHLLIKQILNETDSIEKKWAYEQYRLFEKLSNNHSMILANSLSGHQLNGLTLEQIARLKKVSPGEVYFNKLQAISNYLNQIIDNSELSLHQYVLEDMLKRYNFGLTSSAYHTLELLSNDLSINEIARKKRVKQSTIKEHILEIAIKLPQINLLYLVPEEMKKQLNNYFDQTTKRQFKEIVERISNLEFYQYRLMELEWIRRSNKDEK